MPNGRSKNLVRLSMLAGAYHAKHRAWPDELHAAAIIVWDLAQILDGDQFALLSSRLRIVASPDEAFAISGCGGSLRYSELGAGEQPPDEVDRGREWLGVKMRVGEYEGLMGLPDDGEDE